MIAVNLTGSGDDTGGNLGQADPVDNERVKEPEVSKRLNEYVQLSDPWADARCRDRAVASTGLFFSDLIPDIARAKAICATCSLVEPCLEGALARREPLGVWGGQLFANGKILAQKRKRGRPPKHPRPDFQLSA